MVESFRIDKDRAADMTPEEYQNLVKQLKAAIIRERAPKIAEIKAELDQLKARAKAAKSARIKADLDDGIAKIQAMIERIEAV